VNRRTGGTAARQTEASTAQKTKSEPVVTVVSETNGNAAAVKMQAIFPFDMTLFQVTCTGCDATNAIGATATYLHGIGKVIRCPSCNNVFIRIVHASGHFLLDMLGVRVLQIKEGKPGPFLQGLVPAQSLAQKCD
jgi:hypothetical protein